MPNSKKEMVVGKPSGVTSAELVLHEQFRQQLNKLRQRSAFTDLAVMCSGSAVLAEGGEQQTVFRVHKVVVCSASSYFHQLLMADLDVDQEERVDTVALHGVDPQVLKTLIDFMYVGELDLQDLPYPKIPAVPACAHKLGISSIVEAFVPSLCKIVSVDNLHFLVELQEVLKDRELNQILFNFMASNINQLSTNPAILSLEPERFKRVLTAAIHQGLSPDHALRSVVLWIRRDSSKRCASLDSLWDVVDLKRVTNDYVMTLLENRIVFEEMPMLKEKLMQHPVNPSPFSLSTSSHPSRGTIEDFSLPSSITPPTTSSDLDLDAEAQCDTRNNQSSSSPTGTELLSSRPKCHLRRNLPEPQMVIVGRDEANRASVIFHSPSNDEWSGIEDLGLSLEYRQGLGYHDDCIYFIGGEDDRGDKMDTCLVRDLVTHETRTMARLRIARASPCIAFTDDAILVMGGLGRFGNALSHMERLDGADGAGLAWCNAPPLRDKRSDEATACVIKGQVFVIGGGTHKCEMYDRQLTSWQELPPLPMEFRDLVPLGAVAGGKMYVFNYYKPVVVYWLDVATRSWHQVAAKGSCPEWVLQVTGVGKKLLAALDKSKRFFLFNTETHTWQTGSKFPRCMAHPAFIAAV